MVDATNLNIFGLTCALAWQLPDKTFYTEKQTEETMNNSNVSSSDFENERVDKNVSQQSTENIHHFDTYYDRSNYHSQNVKNGYYYDHLKAMSKYEDWQNYRTKKMKWNYSHEIYPALRMRRHIVHHDDKTIHFDVGRSLQHHRDTRFSLYKSIEKYLNAYVWQKGVRIIERPHIAVGNSTLQHEISFNRNKRFS